MKRVTCKCGSRQIPDRSPIDNKDRCEDCFEPFQVTESNEIAHPAHYGGDVPYEAIKVIEAWGLGFCLGNTVKYISRCGKKGDDIEDLEKAAWYLQREIQRRLKERVTP